MRGWEGNVTPALWRAPLLLEPTSCHHLQTRPPQGWEGRDQGWEALVYRYEEHMCFLILP